MQHTEGLFQGCGGAQLYYQRWLPDDPPVGILVLVHGLGGHSTLFNNGVRCLLPQGYAVYAMDLRGHGRSPGQRGHIQHWSELREDLQAFLTFVRAQDGTQRYFLWGHSLGGTICLDYALHYPDRLQGLILSAPALGPVGVASWKIVLGQLLSHVWPRFNLKVGLDHAASSRDVAVLAARAADPLRHESGSARLASEYFRTVRWIHRHCDRLEVPLLILQGEADRITSPHSSRAFFEQIQVKDKTYRGYPDSYHDLYADLNYMEVISDLADWLHQHSDPVTTLALPLQCLTLV
ncbi:MAG: lysophospholipase [Thermosynechococcaceae cyanobacterium]